MKRIIAFWRKSLTFEIMGSFWILLLLALFLVGWLAYVRTSTTLIEYGKRQIEAVGLFKQEQLNNWLDQQEETIVNFIQLSSTERQVEGILRPVLAPDDNGFTDLSVQALAFSEQHLHLVSYGADETIRAWQLPGGEPLFSPYFFKGGSEIDFGSNDHYLQFEGEPLVLNVPAGQPAPWIAQNERPGETDFSPDGQWAAYIIQEAVPASEEMPAEAEFDTQKFSTQIWPVPDENNIAPLYWTLPGHFRFGGRCESFRQQSNLQKPAEQPLYLIGQVAEDTIEVWDVASKDQLAQYSRPGKIINCFELSPDGQFALIFWRLSSSAGGAEFLGWELVSVQSGETVIANEALSVDVIKSDFSADGRWLLISTATRLRLYDLQRGERVLDRGSAEPRLVLDSFSADGRWLVGSFIEKRVVLPEGTEPPPEGSEPPSDGEPPEGAELLPEESFVTLALWRLGDTMAAGEPTHEIETRGQAAWQVEFTANGSWLKAAAVGGAQTLVVNLFNGSEPDWWQAAKEQNEFQTVIASTDGSYLLAYNPMALDVARLWQTGDGIEPQWWRQGRSDLTRMDAFFFSENGRWLVAASARPVEEDEPTLRVWDLQTATETVSAQPLLSPNFEKQIRFVGDGQGETWLIVGDNAGQLAVWNLETGRQMLAAGHDSRQYTELSRRILDLVESTSAVERIELIDATGQVLFSSDAEARGESRRGESYFAGLTSTGARTIYATEDGSPQITLAVTAGDYDPAIYMTADLSLVAPQAIVEQVTISGELETAYLLTGSRELVSLDEIKPVYQADSSFTTALALRQDIFVDSVYDNYAGVSSYGTIGWLDEMDLSVVVEAPRQQIVAPALRMAGLMALIGLLSLGVMTIGVYAVARRISKPILLVAEEVHHFEADSESYHPESLTPVVSREDEIGYLARAFDGMVVSIQQASALKDEFMANTSHELRTPLNGIIGLSESLLDGAAGPVTPEQAQNLEMIVSSGRRLANLVDSILDFSRLKHHELEINPVPVDLRAMTEMVFNLSWPLVRGKDLMLVNEISEDVPLVLADENRLQQILHNLIGNAIKFTEAGQVTVSAVVMAVEEGDGTAGSKAASSTLAITVADTGMGIAADKQQRIFESFEQGDGSTARIYGGTGLGLAITRQLVDLHGGRIWVESTLGEGSRFTFTMPFSTSDVGAKRPAIKRADAPTPAVSPAPAAPSFAVRSTGGNGDVVESSESDPAAITQITGEGFDILMVDDEPVNLQVLSNMLGPYGFSISKAENGMEALQLIEEGLRPDLILLDIMMPRMSGYEVLEKLREIYPPHQLPVMILTAKNQTNDLVTGFNTGANDYLTKPFAKDELLARLQTHLRLTKINMASSRFVPAEFLNFLHKESIVDIRLGDHVSQEMTVLFSDVRSFTSISEKMTPQENFDFVNEYLQLVSPVIREHAGFIVKYLGDGMMAIFPSNADDAVRAAIGKFKAVAALNKRRRAESKAAIQIGVGIHTGHMMVGMVGEPGRMQGDAFSDNVNLTARLEGLTKHYGISLIISQETYEKLVDPDQYNIRFLDWVQVKGRKEPIAIYEVFDGDEPELLASKQQILPDFKAGVDSYYRQDFATTIAQMAKVLSVIPNDRTTHLYLEQATRWARTGVPDDWDGATVMDKK